MMEAYKRFGLILLVLLFILYYVSLFGKEWLKFEGEYVGLWETCNAKECKWMLKTPSYAEPFLDWYSAVRAFLVLTCIFNAAEILLMYLHICHPVHFKIKPIKICLVFTDMFLVVAVIVFGVEKKNIFEEEWDLGWTYYVTCFAMAFTVLVTIYFLSIQDYADKYNMHYNQPGPSSFPQVVTTQAAVEREPEKVEIPKGFMRTENGKERIVIPSSFRPTRQTSVDNDQKHLSENLSTSYYSEDDSRSEYSGFI